VIQANHKFDAAVRGVIALCAQWRAELVMLGFDSAEDDLIAQEAIQAGSVTMLEPVFPNFSLEGRRALVTGASRGIGQALAVGLARFGADVAICARDSDRLQLCGELIEAAGRKAVPFQLDVRDIDAITPAIEKAASRLKGLDILINNAGVEEICSSIDVDEALWDRIVDTNLKGAFFVAQSAAKQMREGGCMVNLASLTSGVGVPGATPYGASKTGILGMTRALATEWAPKGIRVNAIAPGYFRTGLTEVFYQNEAWCEAMLQKIPIGRFGNLDDLIGATVFLSSDAARYVTGQMLYIDGGFMASI
jgi:NAD(P)-dependent dehydrogenase (short-subunit alcohol dehydrogenase family)